MTFHLQVSGSLRATFDEDDFYEPVQGACTLLPKSRGRQSLGDASHLQQALKTSPCALPAHVSNLAKSRNRVFVRTRDCGFFLVRVEGRLRQRTEYVESGCVAFGDDIGPVGE